MQAIEEAILRTVLYADVFSFPLTAAEIHHFLIHHHPTSPAEIVHALEASPRLRQCLHQQAGYVVCAGREALIPLRQARDAASHDLWPKARTYGRWLARLPFVRLVAVTGALAVRNAASAQDDLDFLLVTAPGRVWLARAGAVVLVRLARLRGVELCPNYVLAETNLVQERQNVFIAHEVTQMIPLYGLGLYTRLRAHNVWVQDHLPNALDVFYAEPELRVGWAWGTLKSLLERLLSGSLGDALENWEYHRKVRRLSNQMQTPHSAARLDETQVRGHFNDHGHFVLEQYRERLRVNGLTHSAPCPKAGD